MTLIKNGNETTCIPNDSNRLEEVERNEYAKELIKRMQRDHPEQIDEIIQQERQRQEIEELDKLKQAPVLHMASTAHDIANNEGTKRLSPSELRRIAKISNSVEYQAAFNNYHKKNTTVAAAVDAKAAAASLSASTTDVSVEKKTPCANTVKSFYKLQERIVSGGISR